MLRDSTLVFFNPHSSDFLNASSRGGVQISCINSNIIFIAYHSSHFNCLPTRIRQLKEKDGPFSIVL